MIAGKKGDLEMVQIKLTGEQRAALSPLFSEVCENNESGIGCVIVAQVYEDGIVAKVVSGDEATALIFMLGGSLCRVASSLSERNARKHRESK